eukprot:scaffold16334_cov133-Isochrysis_galbana.AAC.1
MPALSGMAWPSTCCRSRAAHESSRPTISKPATTTSWLCIGIGPGQRMRATRATVQQTQVAMGRKASFHRSSTISGESCRLDRFRAHRCSRRAICLERRSEARATCRRAAVPMTVAARSAGENLLGWTDRSFRARMVTTADGPPGECARHAAAAAGTERASRCALPKGEPPRSAATRAGWVHPRSTS